MQGLTLFGLGHRPTIPFLGAGAWTPTSKQTRTTTRVGRISNSQKYMSPAAFAAQYGVAVELRRASLLIGNNALRAILPERAAVQGRRRLSSFVRALPLAHFMRARSSLQKYCHRRHREFRCTKTNPGYAPITTGWATLTRARAVSGGARGADADFTRSRVLALHPR